MRIAVANRFEDASSLRRCAGACAHPPLMVSVVTRFGMPFGVAHDPHEVGGAQRRSRRLFMTASRFCFCFQSRGPDPLRGGGRAPTHPEIKNARPIAKPVSSSPSGTYIRATCTEILTHTQTVSQSVLTHTQTESHKKKSPPKLERHHYKHLC